MLKIGLTGGTGSGKSTVAGYFAELGATIIDADSIAHEIVAPGTAPLAKITEHFGQAILTETGKLNRDKLRQVIFADSTQRVWLENLLHPLIRQELQRRVQQVTTAYCLLVIPLLLEKGMEAWVDRTLVVDTAEHLQMQRIRQRDQVSDEQINAMLATQVTRQQRLSAAVDIIRNDGTLPELKQQVKQLHERYLELAK